MKKITITLFLCLCLTLALPLCALGTEEAASAIGGEENYFSILFSEIGEHLSPILSAVSALLAAIVALGYKKGLLPLLKSGLGAIGAATKEWGQAAEDYGKEAKEICEIANNSVQFIEKQIEKMDGALKTIENRLAVLDEQTVKGETTNTLLRGQLDMLLDIFLCSSLPQFEKDRVSQRAEQLKRLLEKESRADGGNESDAE